MVGPSPTDARGKIVPMAAAAARRKAGVTDYEDDHKRLLEKLKAYGIRKSTRLSIPLHEPTALPEIAEILHGLASDITALHNQTNISEFSRMFELHGLAVMAEIRIKARAGLR
jgi:poly(3-hydroxybutyrate) depolymerase